MGTIKFINRKWNIAIILFLLLLLLGLAFYLYRESYSRAKASASFKKKLILYCGAGIRPVAEKLIETFEKKHNLKINVTYGGSGHLLAQITSLGKGDLFMPGAELYVNLAIEKGLALPETKQIVGYFVPVIFVQKGNPKKIRALQDLTQSGLRIGIGDPRACAVGKKTIKILEKNGLYQSIKKNIVYKSATVNELGLAIQLKTVDAVILWDANVQHFLSYGEAVPIPVEQNIPSRIPIVLLKASKYPREAQAFINFATSEEGKKILRECGYTVSLKVKDT